MGTISRQTTWSTGDTLTASAINSEFDNILSTANGSINADNLGVTAGQASALKAVVLDSNKDFANVTGSNQIRNLTLSGSLKIGTTFLPDASGGADLGSTSLEWGDVYVADDKYLYMGSGQDIKIGYDETTTDSLAISAAEGAGLSITLRADEGDDAGDEWKLLVADGGTMTLGNDIASAGTFVTHLTLTPHATVSSSTLALAGALTVAGTAGITGVATVGGLTIGSAVINEAELETIDGITAGTVAASKAVVVDSDKDIASFRNVTLTGELVAATLDISGNVDIDGTTNLDAVDIDGATQIDGTVTVGVNGTGYDVQLFGDTPGSSVLWDQSADDLILTNAGIAVGSDATGDVYYRDANGFLARLGVGSDGQVLTSTGTVPNWEAAGAGSVAADDISTGDAAVSIATTSGNITIDAQANDADVIIKVDDGGSAVTALTLDGSDEGNAIFVNDVQLKSDGALLEFGADLDTTLTHTDGTGLTLNSTNKLTFGDAASFIQQSADGTLRIDGEAIIDLNASTRVDVSGDLKVGGEVQTASIGYTDGDNAITIADGGGVTTAGTLATTGAATLASMVCTAGATFGGGYGSTGATISTAGVGQFNGALTTDGVFTAASLDISGDADIDGTLEADAITIGDTAIGSIYGVIAGSSSIATVGTVGTGTWQATKVASAYLDDDTAHLSATQTFTGDKTFTGTVTVGVNDTGKDVKFFGASDGAFMLYDEDVDTLEVRGPSADASTSTGKLLLSTALTDINDDDVLGRIDFGSPLEAGTGDSRLNGAAMWAEAEATFTASVNSTALVFATNTSAAATERMRIHSGGQVTISKQPAFAATAPGTGTDQTGGGAWVDPVAFTTQIHDDGGDYTEGSSLFTAPVTGRYLLAASISFNNQTSSMTGVHFLIVTSNRNYNRSQKAYINEATGGYDNAQITVVADMDATDTAYCKLQISGDTDQCRVGGPNYNLFSGCLLA